MFVIKGKSVYGGVAIGNIDVYNKKPRQVVRYKVSDTAAEIKRFFNARESAEAELDKLYKDACRNVGESNAAIFSIHHMMLEDEDFCESIENIIKNEEVNAEYAIGVTCDNFSEMFRLMDDSYMRERASDVRDISDRLLDILGGKSNDTKSDTAKIIAADDLLPSETVQMDKSKVLAFITKKGSINSHTAILARTMNIPAIVGIGRDLTEFDGKFAIVDGFNGIIYIEPDAATTEQMQMKKREDEEQKRLLQLLKGQESKTVDGKRVNVYANIGGLGDVGDVLKNDADGIGLFRSEFLYLKNKDYPDENEQFAVYKNVVQNMAGKKVVIRTMDIGADKQIDYFNLEPEENPALGYRAVRICLEREEIFKTQLRALYRASAFGDVAVMVPMIVSKDEVLRVKKIINDIKAELTKSDTPFNPKTEFGIMIETPAAALISDILAKEVDFFSIGTNDLVQYTLAADRQNPKLENICTPYHKSVLDLIAKTVSSAHANGIWAGICGEAASDTSLTEFFIKCGIDELSVAPSKVLALRKKIRDTDTRKITEIYPSVMTE